MGKSETGAGARRPRFGDPSKLRFSLAGLWLAASFTAPLCANGQPGGDSVSFQVCSSVPNAACIAEPRASTPVAPQFRASYRVYLDMKEKAHGGTVYTRADYAKMPDWSGIFA